MLSLELFPFVLTVLVPFLEVLQFLGLSFYIFAETSVFLLLLNLVVVVQDLAQVMKGLCCVLFQLLLPQN